VFANMYPDFLVLIFNLIKKKKERKKEKKRKERYCIKQWHVCHISIPHAYNKRSARWTSTSR